MGILKKGKIRGERKRKGTGANGMEAEGQGKEGGRGGGSTWKGGRAFAAGLLAEEPQPGSAEGCTDTASCSAAKTDSCESSAGKMDTPQNHPKTK